MYSVLQIIDLILDIVWFFVIAHVVMSWLISFDVLNLRQPFVAQIWNGLTRILEPLYRPIRRILPPTGGLDLAPLIVLVGLMIIRIVVANNAAAFY
ncbi:YggT family protein [Pseudooceanicola aestuarii]|uniref:YggT family protein n=1 Tax=Pseudooceanicola aestuarii TaxID=2697319 RepID=UPI0013D16EC2|nr:YggT family protein [Pseudooceanicola aestuarii]